MSKPRLTEVKDLSDKVISGTRMPLQVHLPSKSLLVISTHERLSSSYKGADSNSVSGVNCLPKPAFLTWKMGILIPAFQGCCEVEK